MLSYSMGTRASGVAKYFLVDLEWDFCYCAICHYVVSCEIKYDSGLAIRSSDLLHSHFVRNYILMLFHVVGFGELSFETVALYAVWIRAEYCALNRLFKVSLRLRL